MHASVIDQLRIINNSSCPVVRWEVDVLKVGMIAQTDVVINLNSGFLYESGAPIEGGVVSRFVGVELGA